MPVDASNLTLKVIQTTLASPPAALNPAALRQIFADLGRLEYETFAPSPDGGAILGNVRKQKQIAVSPGARAATIPVEISAQRAVEEIVACMHVVETHLPVGGYILLQTALTSHLPVTAQTAADLIAQKVFRGKDAAFNALGPGRIGTGIKVFLSGAQSTVAMEPLLNDPGLIFIQYVVINQLPFSLQALQGLLETTVRYHDNQIREFVNQMLVGDL